MGKIYKRDCAHCGEEYRGRGEKYCSTDCANADKRADDSPTIPSECEREGCEEVHRNERYCSLDCQYKARRSIEPRACKWCGNEFRPKDDKHSYCSRPCYIRARRHGDDEAASEDPPPKRKMETTLLEDGNREWKLFGGEPHSYDEAVEKLGIDEDRWEVTRWNRWEQKPDHWCHQIRCTPRVDVIDVREVVDDALDQYRRGAPALHTVDYDHDPDPDRRLVLEPYLTDQHISMYAYAPETRGVHYDTEIATKLYLSALKENVRKARRMPGEVQGIVFPVGNDLAHTDQWVGDVSGPATTAGTPQDTDTRRRRMYKMLRHTLEEALLYLREVAPVRVPIVEGNHDSDTAFSLGEVMDARFHDDPHVTVQNSDNPREYVDFGATLLCFAHGDKVADSRLPMLPQIEATDANARVQNMNGVVEWHTGHTHHLDVRGFAMEATEDMTMRIRRLPTLCPRDAWHSSQGYSHIRASEAFVWSYEYGFEGLVNCTPRSVEDVAA